MQCTTLFINLWTYHNQMNLGLISQCCLHFCHKFAKTVVFNRNEFYALLKISCIYFILSLVCFVQACCAVLQSWVSRKFMTGWYIFDRNQVKHVTKQKVKNHALFFFPFFFCSVVLFPVAVTFFITWWFIQFVDGFFSPLYAKLGIDIFGNCGFQFSLTFSTLNFLIFFLHTCENMY